MMRIVQTLWTATQDLNHDNFGWLSAQYHIMGWALSCLTLKEHYPDLHLYTDSKGHQLLIDYLDLPYKSVTVCYDDVNYSSQLWALPKLLTYRVQEQPFIHIDGDVFIWKKFTTELENAGLISQNRELGTDYYKAMMNNVEGSLCFIPDILHNKLQKTSIISYNAGIFGGSDLYFFKNYTDIALDFVNRNFANGNSAKASINVNILFEQILFASLAEIENKKVDCYYDNTFNDNGYLFNEFADLSATPLKKTYLHLIGGLKRNHVACELIARTLYNCYPEYFFKIINLFQNKHSLFKPKIYKAFPCFLQKLKSSCRQAIEMKQDEALRMKKKEESVENHTNQKDSSQITIKLKTIIDNYVKKWHKISFDTLKIMEDRCTDYFEFFALEKPEQLTTLLSLNPHIEILEESFDWTPEEKNTLGINDSDLSEPGRGLAYVPQLFFKGYQEFVIDELAYNILTILDSPISVSDLQTQLETDCFSIKEDTEEPDTIYTLLLLKLKHLFFHKAIFIERTASI